MTIGHSCRLAALVAALLCLMSSPSHAGCGLFGHDWHSCWCSWMCHSCQPQTVTAGCNPCLGQQTTVQYVPETAYRQATVCAPVTTYKAACACDPATGQMVSTMKPVTTLLPQRRWVPYTTYRAVTVPTTTLSPAVSTVTAGSGCVGCSGSTTAAATPGAYYPQPSASSMAPSATSDPVYTTPQTYPASPDYPTPAASDSSGPMIYSTPTDSTPTGQPSLGLSLPTRLPAASYNSGRNTIQMPPQRPRPQLEERFQPVPDLDGRTAWRSADEDDRLWTEEHAGETMLASSPDRVESTGPTRLATYERPTAAAPEASAEGWSAPTPEDLASPIADQWRQAR
jgi:hypothetical protein